MPVPTNAQLESKDVRLTPLGGVGRFGRNALLVEDFGFAASLVIDCGVRLLGGEGGFDLGLPDFSPLERSDNFCGYVVTHGHEDHIGALPYAPTAPVYAHGFTRDLILRRFQRTGVKPPVVEQRGLDTPFSVGPFEVRYLAVSHSVPDATSVALTTSAGVVLHSGDFRVDLDPLLGPPTDVNGLTALGDQGVRCLFADSTGAGLPGANAGERSVVQPLTQALSEAKGRVMVATFSSNVQRVLAIAQACQQSGRKLALMGRGLVEVMRLAHQNGFVMPADVMIDSGDLGAYVDRNLCLAMTGSQAEPGSALWRLAHDHDPRVVLKENDAIIFSARIIPGAELAVAALKDRLAKRGATVLDGSQGRHVSGHGRAEDCETLLLASRPDFFVPVHGGHFQLQAHRAVATGLGLQTHQVLDLSDGDAVTFGQKGKPTVIAGSSSEPKANDGQVCLSPVPVVAMRRRMERHGVLVALPGPPLRLIPHAMFPLPSASALDTLIAQVNNEPDLKEALIAKAPRLLDARPEIVVVDDNDDAGLESE